MTAPAVVLDNLTVRYRKAPALLGISGQFVRGSLTAMIGPNGAGKSTLLKCIAGLLPQFAGGVRSEGGSSLAVGVPRPLIAYLPQLSELDRSFPMEVLDCVLLGAWGAAGAWGGVTQAMLGRAQTALRAVGLQGFERRPMGALSSGQLQRVLFARLLVQDAQLILLDEPFNAVDTKTTAALLALLRAWHCQGRTVIAALHDDSQVRAHFPQTLLLARQLVGWGATAEVLTDANLQRARAISQGWDEDESASNPAYAVQQPSGVEVFDTARLQAQLCAEPKGA